MSLRQRLQDDMKDALRAGEKERLGVIRMAIAAVKQREIDERTELDEPQVLAVIEKMVKQRRDSISQYQSGGRPDLAEKEQSEIDLLSSYLPQAMTDEELEALVEEVLSATGASTMKDMGRVMGQIKAQAQGRADMAQVSAMIKARLSG